MKQAALFTLTMFIAGAFGLGCTEPSAEDRALAKVWVVHVDRPATGAIFAPSSEWLTASAFDSAGVLMTEPLSFRWESSDSTSISVNQEGRITAKRPGGPWIYARLPNGIHGYLSLTVHDPANVYIINPDSSRMLIGQRRKLMLQERHTPDTVTGLGWASSNTAVATVDDNGLVTAVAPGLATVSVVHRNTTFRSEVYVAAVATPLRFASVAADGFATCGLTADGTAYCWGRVNDGALGSSERIDRCVSYTWFRWAGGSPPPYGAWSRGVWSCAMEPVRVETTLRFASLESSGGVVCGTTSAGETHCWGATGGLTGGASGPTVVAVSAQLRFTSFRYPCGVTAANDAWCFGDPALRGAPASASTTPTQVTGAGLWRTVAAVAVAGTRHRCGVTTGDVVQCWGDNALGQLGTGNTSASSAPVPVQSPERFSVVGVNSRESCALSLSQLLYCWGNNVATPTPVSTTLRFTALVVSDAAVCALGTDAVRYCRTSAGAMIDATPGFRFRSFSSGSPHHCGIRQDGLAYCWSNNDYGQLGTGDLVGRGTPTAVVGQ